MGLLLLAPCAPKWTIDSSKYVIATITNISQRLIPRADDIIPVVIGNADSGKSKKVVINKTVKPLLGVSTHTPVELLTHVHCRTAAVYAIVGAVTMCGRLQVKGHRSNLTCRLAGETQTGGTA